MPEDEGPNLDLFSAMLRRGIAPIAEERNRQRQHESNMQSMGLNSIARRMRGQPQGQPMGRMPIEQMDTRIGYDSGGILPPSKKIGHPRDDFQLAPLTETDDRRFTQEQDRIKNNMEMGKLDAQNKNTKDIAQMRGQQTIDAQNLRSKDAMELEKARQRGREIIADKNIAGRVDLEETKADLKGKVDPRRDAIKGTAQETLDSLNELIDEKGNLRPEIEPAIGASYMFDPRGYLPGTQAQTANRKVQNFLAKQVLSTIAQLKAQSKTGATGFGAMNLKELNVLEQAANSLNQKMPEGDFARELSKIRDKMNLIMQDAPEGDGQEMVKTQRNSKGETREVISTDGGKTWQPRKK